MHRPWVFHVRAAFVDAMAAIMVGYRSFICPNQPDADAGQAHFDVAGFIESKPADWHPFLRTFLRGQAFSSFIQDVGYVDVLFPITPEFIGADPPAEHRGGDSDKGLSRSQLRDWITKRKEQKARQQTDAVMRVLRPQGVWADPVCCFPWTARLSSALDDTNLRPVDRVVELSNQHCQSMTGRQADDLQAFPDIPDDVVSTDLPLLRQFSPLLQDLEYVRRVLEDPTSADDAARPTQPVGPWCCPLSKQSTRAAASACGEMMWSDAAEIRFFDWCVTQHARAQALKRIQRNMSAARSKSSKDIRFVLMPHSRQPSADSTLSQGAGEGAAAAVSPWLASSNICTAIGQLLSGAVLPARCRLERRQLMRRDAGGASPPAQTAFRNSFGSWLHRDSFRSAIDISLSDSIRAIFAPSSDGPASHVRLNADTVDRLITDTPGVQAALDLRQRLRCCDREQSDSDHVSLDSELEVSSSDEEAGDGAVAIHTERLRAGTRQQRRFTILAPGLIRQDDSDITPPLPTATVSGVPAANPAPRGRRRRTSYFISAAAVLDTDGSAANGQHGLNADLFAAESSRQEPADGTGRRSATSDGRSVR